MWKGSMIQVDLVWHFFSTHLQGNKYMEYLPAIQNHGLNLFRYQFIIKLDHPNFGQWFYLGEDFLMSMSWILISLSSPSLIYRTHHTSNLSLMKSSTHKLTVKSSVWNMYFVLIGTQAYHNVFFCQKNYETSLDFWILKTPIMSRVGVSIGKFSFLRWYFTRGKKSPLWF